MEKGRMKGSSVRPKKWTNVIDLYDDGEVSFIAGNYDGAKKISVAMRWNKDPSEPGFPKQGKYPTWFVLPDWVAKIILPLFKNSPNSMPHEFDKTIQKITEQLL